MNAATKVVVAAVAVVAAGIIADRIQAKAEKDYFGTALTTKSK